MGCGCGGWLCGIESAWLPCTSAERAKKADRIKRKVTGRFALESLCK
jgi:hypothetical protein